MPLIEIFFLVLVVLCACLLYRIAGTLDHVADTLDYHANIDIADCDTVPSEEHKP